VHLEWTGEYGETASRHRRFASWCLSRVLLIAGVLYAATQSLIDTFIIMAQIPVAVLGGVLALIITALRSAFPPAWLHFNIWNRGHGRSSC